MHTLLNATWPTFALTFAIQFVLFVRWLYRRIRNDELNRAFVRDMATSHLPHIYDRLEKICEHAGIERTRPPPRIRWVELNGKSQDT